MAGNNTGLRSLQREAHTARPVFRCEGNHMSIELPAIFGSSVDSLVACIIRYEASVSETEKAGIQREALSTCCLLLSSLNLDQLYEAVRKVVSTMPRDQAAQILRDTRLYALFEIMEDELLQRAGIGFAARERILEVLSSVRYEAAEEATTLDAKAIVDGTAELRMWVCKAKDDILSSATAAEQDSAGNERHTKLVNSLGTVAWVVNSATAIAVTASVLALPVMSAAAVGASLVVGKVAESRKARKAEPEPPRTTPVGRRYLPPPGFNPKVKR
jgi:hypothetical protein